MTRARSLVFIACVRARLRALSAAFPPSLLVAPWRVLQAARVKQLILESADQLPGLPVASGRRLNARRAAQAAAAATDGSYRACNPTFIFLRCLAACMCLRM
jgi:hypothetical protein